MADHNKPTITSTYANYTSEIDARMDDLAMLNDPSVTTVTNPSNGYKRWNSISYKFEKYNSGNWVDLSTQYNFGAISTVKDDLTTLNSTSSTNPVVTCVNSSATNASKIRISSTQGTDTNKYLDIFYAPSTYSAVTTQASFGVVESYSNKGLILSALNGSDGIKLQVGNRVDALKIKNDSVIETTSDLGVGTSVSKPSGFNRFVAIGDSDSGIGSLGDGYISVVTNNVERLRFNPIDWTVELGTAAQGNTSTQVGIYMGNQTNPGLIFANNDRFGLYSPNADLTLDKRSGSNANAWLSAGNSINLSSNTLNLSTGGSVKRSLSSTGTLSGNCTGFLYEDMTLNPPTDSVGKQIKLANAGSSVQKIVFEAVVNENAIPLGGNFCSANTDGSFTQSFTVTPPGVRTSDRSITALGIHGNASIHAYNGAMYARSGYGSANNANNCGYAFEGDSDTGWFNPAEGYLHGFVNGDRFFEADFNRNRKFNFGPNNQYALLLQADGNAVVYDNAANVKFSSNDFSKFYQGTKAITGYQPLPGGLILQWGVVTTISSPTTITLPTAFTTNCFAGGATIKSTLQLASNVASAYFYAISTSQATITPDFSGSPSIQDVQWWCIGV